MGTKGNEKNRHKGTEKDEKAGQAQREKEKLCAFAPLCLFFMPLPLCAYLLNRLEYGEDWKMPGR
jgi:hypothetical protein